MCAKCAGSFEGGWIICPTKGRIIWPTSLLKESQGASLGIRLEFLLENPNWGGFSFPGRIIRLSHGPDNPAYLIAQREPRRVAQYPVRFSPRKSELGRFFLPRPDNPALTCDRIIRPPEVDQGQARRDAQRGGGLSPGKSGLGAVFLPHAG